MRIIRAAECIVLSSLIAAALIFCAFAECSVCKGGSPSAQQDVLSSEWAAFLGDEPANSSWVYTATDDPILTAMSAVSEGASTNGENSITDARSPGFASVLVPIANASSSGVILDISPNSTEYIPGAINIPYTKFLEAGGALKPVLEMAKVLGDAGISENDDVLIYGECQPCGGGPSAATYVYWIMKYLGHERVRLLDGGIDDWVAAKQPTAAKPSALPKKNYTATINSNLLATYEYVRSGAAQIVDARTAEEVSAGSIPGAVNIPYDSVLNGKKIKDEAELEKLFVPLSKSKPVVVYTNTGVKASMVWFALSLLGYDARIYSWQDWTANLPRLDIDIQEAKAQPNPAKIGDAVQITVTFVQEMQTADGNETPERNETVLTVKGCATCGFGSPQGFADLSSTNGVVQIGSSTKAQQGASDDGFKVTAKVKSQAGATVSSVIMKRVSGDEFAGFWNANVAAGTYRVDIVASASEVTKTFTDVLEIQVTGTSKYKNLKSQ
ncbi:MAG: putative thiosulfate sulfurtransferase [Methanosaeta sp. PtaB.Bin018]|nr:sulfurtransferase [Methanothrix sp.]OPX76110.1 MAG: putative thiosulfate sulfurtransferase [Methanosaeta sp. PtaB.Bin018]OPY45905.1 MAG: putative thiosulfate sulfurtransferase [Methanosaeta sp. PtaU1.Bin016]